MHVITSKLEKGKLTLETTKMIGIVQDLHRTSLKFGGKRNYMKILNNTDAGLIRAN